MSQPEFVVDTNVQPYFRTNAEIRDYMPDTFNLRQIPDVELSWYQAPRGDYHESLYGDHYPGSDPESMSRHLFEERGVDIAILNPLTRGNLPDYQLNSQICASTNDWLAERWLEHGNGHGRFRGTIRVNPEDPVSAVAEIERWAGHPHMVQVGVPMQSREPYGKPQFGDIWDAAARHGLPVAVHINGGNGVDLPPTPVGHCRTYPHYAAFMPLNYFIHLATLIIEGVFERHPNLVFVFQDGGSDILTPLMWRLDSFWMSLRDQTPWVGQYPSEYLARNVRFCSTRMEGPTSEELAQPWMELTSKSNLLMFASHYPHWSMASPEDVVPGLDDDQLQRLLWRNASDVYKLQLGG